MKKKKENDITLKNYKDNIQGHIKYVKPLLK